MVKKMLSFGVPTLKKQNFEPWHSITAAEVQMGVANELVHSYANLCTVYGYDLKIH